MPRKKINPKYEGGKHPNPNTLPAGQNFGGYQTVTPGPVPTAGHPIPVRQYPGERMAPTRPWNKRRRRATGR